MYEMDTIDQHCLDSRFTDGDQRHIYESDRNLDQNGSGASAEGWNLNVSLSGGAPWGFTLRGGLEHGEPLIITKVEEGSKAAAVRLQAGDELVSINEVSLSGFRQEAICLVKGSHKTLTLEVKRRMKMVDIVAQKMPSESDVHVARSFLTKILRSSMRRNEPMSRPHSWHATKFNENQSDTAKAQHTPSPVWQARYDASSFSSDLTTGWHQTNLRRVSDQFSSLGSMDSLEHSPHPYASGRLSPSKSNANSVEHLGGGKRDSAYSSFSTSSGTPDYTLSKSNTASTENMLYKVSQWDSGSRPSNGRNSQNLGDGLRQDDRVGYLQLTSGSSGRESPRTEEQSAHRHPSSGRASIGPIWHIPDLKKTIAPSPPPPTPPTRSDSFAATKVHEKGLVPGYPEGPGNHAQSKLQGKGLEKVTDTSEGTQRIYQGSESGLDTCQTYNPPPKSETLNPYTANETYNHPPTQNLNPNKIYSLSSIDVRAGLPSYTQLPYHHRQYSDESTLHAPSRPPFAPKSQNVSSCYSSMQELPTNSNAQHHSHNQIKRPISSASTTAIDQNPDAHSSNRYYCLTSRQHPQRMPQASLVRIEDWKPNSAVEMTHSGVENFQGPPNEKYHTPQVPQHLANNKSNNEYYRQVDGQQWQYTSVSGPCQSLDDAATNVLDIRGNKSNVPTNLDPHFINYPPIKQSEPGKMVGPLRSRESSQEHLISKSEIKPSPPKNPMLHSLSQESGRVGDGQGEMCSGSEAAESVDPQVAKQMRQNDRFATTLRNEIQMRRAQLQKSRSSAALGGSLEAEEPSVWKSVENSPSSDGSFTNTYKDHLKEAQARVLKATSFKRRDLEPVLLEHPGAEVLSVARRDTPPLPSVSEGPLTKHASGGNQVTRICGRKRIPAEKKVRSFSEPEKMNEVGVNEELPPVDSSVSLVNRRKFFEAIGKPAYPRPMPKQTSDDPGLAGGKLHSMESEATGRDSNAKAETAESSEDGPASLQRLGTFAEYEATWSTQRKSSETRPSGRYHSADNILDPGAEERSKPPCFHERSRSSPSDDFYGQNIPVQERKSAEYSSLGKKPSDHNSSPRINQGGSSDLVSKQNQEPPPSYLLGRGLEGMLSDPSSTQYKPPANPASSSDHSILAEPSSFTKNKSPVSQRRPLPRLDKFRCPEDTPLLCSAEGEARTCHSPVRDTSSASVPAPVPGNEPKYSKGPQTEEEHIEATPPSPPSPPGLLSHRAADPTLPTEIQPTMEGHRSPSPQFAPQRLTDKPPVSVSLQDEAPGRMDTVTDDNTTVKKVPIKIVRSESHAEKESRQYLHPSAEALPSPPGSTVPSLSSLGSSEQSSLFCTYTRQREQEPVDPAPAMGPQKPPELPVSVAGPQEGRDQQTGPCEHQSSNGVTSNSLTTPSPSEEDEKREGLARDIIDKDKSLADILDQSKMRTTMDLMEGLFPQGEQLMEEAHQRRRAAPKQTSTRSSDERREEPSSADAAAAALVTSSAYYSTSAPKAELLIKMKDMQEQYPEVDSEEELGEDNDGELANKKHELIASLSKKLQVLREARESVRQDVQDNDALGEEVEATVQTVCKPNELEKFRMFVGDLDKVVSLLLSLSGRLARVENALNSLEEDATLEERRTLTEKHKLLTRQHEDAKELKENLDRRENLVYAILAACLPDESLADYEHFVKMKSALIIEQRKLEDKIKLGEEQLKCLVDSLPLDQRPAI